MLNTNYWAPICFKNIFRIFHMATIAHGEYTQSY